MIRIADLPRLSRRTLLAGGLAAIALPAGAQSSMIGNPEGYARGRLLARVIPGFQPPEPERLTRPLGLEARDAFLFIPSSLDLSQPVPLVLALHGAGQRAADMLGEIHREAARAGVVVVAVSSRASTWDLGGGPVGPDAAFIDEALQTVFDQVAIDPKRLAVLGMSDGASYALSTGMVNGDLFTDVIAFAPVRFVAPTSQGRPRFYVSSGRRDMGTSYANQRKMVVQLEGFGYTVRHHAHGGGHIIDREGLRDSLTRFVAGGVAP